MWALATRSWEAAVHAAFSSQPSSSSKLWGLNPSPCFGRGFFLPRKHAPLVPRDHDDHECPWLRFWTPCLSGLLLFKLEGRQVRFVCPTVDVHGLGPDCSRHGLHDFEFPRSVLSRHRKLA